MKLSVEYKDCVYEIYLYISTEFKLLKTIIQDSQEFLLLQFLLLFYPFPLIPELTKRNTKTASKSKL